MNDTNKQDSRPIPPPPGGGSYTFDEQKWAWVSNYPAPIADPAEAFQAEAGSEQAASATEKE